VTARACAWQCGAGRQSGLDHGLALFSQLVCNKIFLLSFVRTLEQRADFGVRDRVNVASLICVALHTRLDYLTESVQIRPARRFLHASKSLAEREIERECVFAA